MTELCPECKVLKPFLKWAGGKTSILGQITPHFPKTYGRYFEPFLGGGAVALYLKPGKFFLSDKNYRLINCYQQIRDRLKAVLSALDDLISEFEVCVENGLPWAELYYRVREVYNSSKDPVLLAAAFIFLNKTCYNGLYRENRRGVFNVPAGSYSKVTFYDPDGVSAVSEFLQGGGLKTCSFEEVEKAAVKGDFVYMDPPYYPMNDTRSFSSYVLGNFSREDHIRLRNTMVRLTRKGVFCAISNSDHLFVREIYKNFEVHAIESPDLIGSRGETRGKRSEVLICNYRANV